MKLEEMTYQELTNSWKLHLEFWKLYGGQWVKDEMKKIEAEQVRRLIDQKTIGAN